MKNIFITLLTLIFFSCFQIEGQNQTYNSSGTYIFTSNGSLTGIPSGTYLKIECYGAGGGAGMAYAQSQTGAPNPITGASGGGGGGGYAKVLVYYVYGGTLNITVGKGGAGGYNFTGHKNGNDGGTSGVFDPSTSTTICEATGGKGSDSAYATYPLNNFSTGAIGGQGTIGDILINGQNGIGGSITAAGNGGNGAGTLGGNGGISAGNYQPGVDGATYGGGGSGCFINVTWGGNSNTSGGDGADGAVIISDLKVLPLQEIFFKGNNKNGQNHLQWQYKGSSLINKVVLLKSNNKQKFSDIAEFDFHNNENYHYTDNYSISKTTYYQLLFLNQNEKLIASKIIAIDETNKNNITTYPNPATNKLNVVLNNSSKIQNIEIKTLQGQEVIKTNAPQNEQNITLDISNLPKGIYILSAQSENTVVNQKFIKE